MIAKPQRDFPKSAGGAQHTSPEWGKCPLTPILEECLIAKPQQDFSKSAEGVLHTSPIQGESPIVPTLEECLAYAIAPPTNRVHHPPPVTRGIPYWTARVYVTRSNETPQSLPLISLTSPEPTKHLWLPGSSLSPRELCNLNPTLPYKYTVATFSLPCNYLTR